MASNDPYRVLASLQQKKVKLELSTTDLCFLVALCDRVRREALASLEEELLMDVFVQVCDLTEPGAENPRKRATHAIQSLRDERLLARVDGAGLVRAGEYTITPLAASIVDFFTAEETLTRDSLTVLTKMLLSQLGQIKAAASHGGDENYWKREVVEPLRVSVSDLVNGIERRQRGMDSQQEEVTEKIGTLLHKDWFGAVEGCERLLDDTATTLRELNDVLLQDSTLLQALLGEIEQLATDVGAKEAEEAARQVADHVDRVAAWGGARQRTWSAYYQYVQRYLSSVVRLDPGRALSERLRSQLSVWLGNRFHLSIANSPSIQLLRDPDMRSEMPAVTRPRRELENPPEVVARRQSSDINALTDAALEAGAATLCQVLDAVVPGLPPEMRFRAIGQIAEHVAGRVASRIDERPWIPAADVFEIEDWILGRPRACRK